MDGCFALVGSYEEATFQDHLWSDTLFPQPSFLMSSMGKMPGYQALEKQLLAMDQESLQTSPPLSVPGVPSPRVSESLCTSDLGYVVVGEQALLAS